MDRPQTPKVYDKYDRDDKDVNTISNGNMEGYTPYEDPSEKPLFGEDTRRDRFLNLIVGVFTALVVSVTMILAFVFAPNTAIRTSNVFFGIIIMFVMISHLILIYWYRQGDLEPKFRKLIYFNALTIILLCIAAIVQFSKTGKP